MQLTEIITDTSLRELTPHGTKQFPFQYYYDDIQKFNAGFIGWHWHEEFEFLTVETGTVRCRIGSQDITLGAGEGMFINSGIVHSFHSADGAMMPNILFTPEFIAGIQSDIYNNFVAPILASDISHVVFPEDDWGRDIWGFLTEIYLLFQSLHPTRELELHIKTCMLWSILYQHKNELTHMSHSGNTQPMQARLRQMIQFIEQNYTYKLSLEEISVSANISKSEALRCFKTGMQTTPVNFLNKYRLYAARNRLLQSEDPVVKIALSSGFESAGYFGRLFKHEFGMTPMQYRSQLQET